MLLITGQHWTSPGGSCIDPHRSHPELINEGRVRRPPLDLSIPSNTLQDGPSTGDERTSRLLHEDARIRRTSPVGPSDHRHRQRGAHAQIDGGVPGGDQGQAHCGQKQAVGDDVVPTGAEPRSPGGPGHEVQSVVISAGPGPCGDVQSTHEHHATITAAITATITEPAEHLRSSRSRRFPRPARTGRRGRSYGRTGKIRGTSRILHGRKRTGSGGVAVLEPPRKIVHDDGAIGPPLPRPAGPHGGASADEAPAGARPRIDGCIDGWGLGAAARRADPAAPMEQSVPWPEPRRLLQSPQRDDGRKNRLDSEASGCCRVVDAGGCENRLQSTTKPRRLLVDGVDVAHEPIVSTAETKLSPSGSLGARCACRSERRTS